MKVWVAKFGEVTRGDPYESFSILGVFDSKEKAIAHALNEAYKEGSPYVENEKFSTDIYVRFDGQNGYCVVADCWEVL